MIAETAEAMDQLPLPGRGVVMEGPPEKQNAYLNQVSRFAQPHYTDFVFAGRRGDKYQTQEVTTEKVAAPSPAQLSAVPLPNWMKEHAT